MDTAASKTIATVQSLRYRSLKQLWLGRTIRLRIGYSCASLTKKSKDTENANTAPLGDVKCRLSPYQKGKGF